VYVVHDYKADLTVCPQKALVVLWQYKPKNKYYEKIELQIILRNGPEADVQG